VRRALLALGLLFAGTVLFIALFEWEIRDRQPARLPATAPTVEASLRPEIADKLRDLDLPWVTTDAGWEILPGEDARRRWPQFVDWVAAEYGVPVTKKWVTIISRGQTLNVRAPDRGWLVLVIDDVGFQRQPVERLLALEQPMVFAVLPGRPLSQALARRVRTAGQDLMLHQPMEPQSYPRQRPGKYALFVSDSVETWQSVLDRNLVSLAGVRGVNNHMGSRFTANPHGMSFLAGWLREQDLFWLDSLTTNQSQARAACEAVGVPYFARDVFLDHERTEASLDQQITRWYRAAERQGLAIAIGHPHSVTVSGLEAAIARAGKRGLRLVDVDRMLAYARARKPGEAG